MRLSGVVTRNTQSVARYDNAAVRQDKSTVLGYAPRVSEFSSKMCWLRLLSDSYLLAQIHLI